MYLILLAMKNIIDGATFEVTEAGDGAIVSVGEKFEFAFVF